MIKNRDTILEYIQKQELNSNNPNFGLTTIEIADALDMYRSNVSAILNRLVEEKALEKKGTRPLKYSIYKNKDNKDAFENLIGYNGSLKNAVQLAKASMMYPHEKLSTLIVAPVGAGTSYLVNLMYEYGLSTGVIKEDEEFIKVDCRRFILNNENITGFKSDHPKGLIFIDNVNQLDDRGLYNLLELINNKKIEDKDYSDVRIVLGCDSMYNPSLIKELENKIPIKIELPELSRRSKNEKLELINRFFSIESQRSQYKLEVHASAIRALLLYEPEDNVLGINRDIKVACANGYARNYVEKKDVIKIYLNDFSERVKEGYTNVRTSKGDLDALVDREDVYLYDGKETSKKYSNYSDKGTLYEDLEKQLDALSDRGIDENILKDLLTSNVSNLFGEKFNKSRISIEQISKLVDQRVLRITQDFIERCQNTLNKTYKPSVFYGLALHLNALVFNHTKPVKVAEDIIDDVINNHPEYYKMASTLSIVMKEEFGVDLSLDDLIVISSFIIGRKENAKNYPKLLYVLHGNGVAEALKDVTEQLCKTNNIYAYNMLLEDSINKSYEELKELLIEIDSGGGVIVIYDMGSIATMLNRISNETGIQIRSIYQPITLVGIDVARKAAMEKDIDQIYTSIYVENMNRPLNNEKPKAIITLCNTGEGGAVILADYIDKNSKLEYKTFPLAISDRRELINEVDKIREDYNIHCCVGTYNPNLYNVPFINISEVFSVRNEDLDVILKFEKPNNTINDYELICNYLAESSQHLNENNIKNNLYPFIGKIKNIYKLDMHVETGLIVHVAALIDHILENKSIKVNIDKSMYDEYCEDYRIVKKACRDLEKKFNVIFSDDDIMMMVKIIRKV